MDSLQNKNLSLEQLMPLIRELLAMGKTVTIYPRGTSMLPLLRQGRDSVTLAPVPGKLKKYDLPLYRRDDGAYVLHRIVEVGDTYTCVGDNQFDLESGVRDDQLIALATGICRDGKAFSVTDGRYRLYCRLWCGSRRLRKYPTAVKRGIKRRFQK